MTKSTTECLAPISESMVTDQETGPLTPVSGIVIINEHFEPRTPALESIAFEIDVSVLVTEFIPSEAEVPSKKT